MIGVFTIMLGVSIVGLTLLLVLKRREMRTGRVMARGLRPSLNRFFHNVFVVFEQALPALTRRLVHST